MQHYRLRMKDDVVDLTGDGNDNNEVRHHHPNSDGSRAAAAAAALRVLQVCLRLPRKTCMHRWVSTLAAMS